MEGLQSKVKSNHIGKLTLSAAMTAVAHPLTYVKVLIQVGHEPLAPKEVTTIFGKKVLRLPNFIQYAGYIKDTDGWFGLYRGLGPRILHNVISATVANSITSKVKEQDVMSGKETVDILYVMVCKVLSKDIHNKIQGDKSVKSFLKETGNLAIAKTTGIIVSYPFHVISVRMMVQFVGKETQYRNFFSSIKETYNEEGILGFFSFDNCDVQWKKVLRKTLTLKISGLIPHLVGELFALWMFKTLNYIATKYFIDQQEKDPSQDVDIKDQYTSKPEIQNYTQGISQYIASMVTYPFQLITSLMIVNDTRLVAGNPPLMPIYESWTDCWIDLGKKGLRSRGSTLFRRTVTHLPLNS